MVLHGAVAKGVWDVPGEAGSGRWWRLLSTVTPACYPGPCSAGGTCSEMASLGLGLLCVDLEKKQRTQLWGISVPARGWGVIFFSRSI